LGSTFLTHVNTSARNGGGKQAPGGNKKAPASAGGGSNAVGMLLLTFVPWAFFVTVSCLFAFAYHRERLLVAAMVLALAGVSLMLMVLDARNRSGPGGPWYLFLGILCFFAVFSSAFAGLYNYETHMFQYWSYEENRLYTNVLPSEPAEAHLDAGKIIFSPDARVDSTRSVGVKVGAVYCVAPIFDDTQATRVEYWAAGTDCCGSRADFSCDQSWDPEARSGVVIVDNNSFMSSHRNFYMQAVEVAEAAYDIVSAKKPIFVRWVADPQEVQDDFWRSGIGFLVAECCVYLLLSLVFGSAMHVSFRRAME